MIEQGYEVDKDEEKRRKFRNAAMRMRQKPVLWRRKNKSHHELSREESIDFFCRV